jgi:N-acetyl sugar amidotransferase
MKYCIRCLYPESKPDISFDAHGVCSACQAFDARSLIDWDDRAAQFTRLVRDTRRDAADLESTYDCIVPVSGGKDSHAQVLAALEHGMRVLAVTAVTDHLSPIGRRNLDNIARLGCDHIEVKTDPLIRRKINRFTLETIGDISWAEHITIFSIPIRIASMMKIPLIVWGENPQNEYGGPAVSQKATELTQEWLNEFGGLNGLRIDDVETTLGPIGELYRYPELDKNYMLPKGIFLGQFFPWDGFKNANLAVNHGFEIWRGTVEGSYGAYENLDNYQTGIHDYFKYLKFGFGRATDILSNHIRRGRIDREDAAVIAQERDGMFPEKYLDLPLREILHPLDMSVRDFLDVCDNFTNRDLFAGSHTRGDIRPLFQIDGEMQS